MIWSESATWTESATSSACSVRCRCGPGRDSGCVAMRREWARRVQVTDCEAEGLEGVQSALGEYELDADNPARQNVYFTGIRIEPSSSDPAALRAWVALLRDSNPTMARPLRRMRCRGAGHLCCMFVTDGVAPGARPIS